MDKVDDEATTVKVPTFGSWEPIASAPKDAPIIATIAGFNPCVVEWQERLGVGMFADPDAFDHDDERLDEYWGGNRYRPTHWMPLPPAPEDFSTGSDPETVPAAELPPTPRTFTMEDLMAAHEHGHEWACCWGDDSEKEGFSDFVGERFKELK